ncbi:MAG: hypothetical protein N3D73_00340 [Candidatus Diapherotrites archaeon]|nr:hypothetical protein [Candidatus Diapherotrites archaeon]
MYPEDAGAEAPPANYYPEPSIQSKIAYHLEGLVPILIILILALFLAVKFDIITTNTPVLGILADVVEPTKKINVLIISENENSVSPFIIETLNQNSDLVKYRIRSANDLSINPKQKIENYDMIMLAGVKYMPLSLGKAIVEYVKGGGKLITIMDAGIRRPSTPDVLGWEETFEDIIPVTCEKNSSGRPGCIDRIYVRGKLYREDEEHKIMRGFEEVPQEPNAYKDFEILDLTYTGNEIAYIKGGQYQKPYPGIVEKKLVFGKSIYFNYDPGTTPGILMATIDYLK